MDGEVYTPAKPEPRELGRATSTPTASRDGKEVSLDLVKLSKYKVNIRSFHPNPNFEPGGFRFEGDNRGFSLGQSHFGRRRPPGSVISRIWQRYDLDLSKLQTSASLGEVSGLEQQSNPSAPGPGAWALFGSEERYEEETFKPLGRLEEAPWPNTRPHNGQRILGRRSWYGGENYAFLGSRLDKKTLGTTIVPALDVTAELYVRLERVNGYMDIVSLVHGDGFPNCEAFIEDAAGTKLFLGSLVRIGAPSTHLAGGVHQRLFWANALRVRVDAQGNFGNEVGLFARALGGPAVFRDKYPILSIDEFHSRRPNPRIIGVDIGVANSYSMWWNYARPEDIAKRQTADIGREPLRLSAFCDIGVLRTQLHAVWRDGRHFRTTRDNWNNWHLHRDPNNGRDDDDYDLSPDKWRKP